MIELVSNCRVPPELISSKSKSGCLVSGSYWVGSTRPSFSSRRTPRTIFRKASTVFAWGVPLAAVR